MVYMTFKIRKKKWLIKKDNTDDDISIQQWVSVTSAIELDGALEPKDGRRVAFRDGFVQLVECFVVVGDIREVVLQVV